MTCNKSGIKRRLTNQVQTRHVIAKDKEMLGCSKEAGSAAMAAEEIKRKKYSELAKDNHFIPIAQETFGSWGPSGLELLKDIGTRTIIASGNKRARANLFQNISMAMIRGNIINVKSTLPPLNKNKEFLFLN